MLQYYVKLYHNLFIYSYLCVNVCLRDFLCSSCHLVSFMCVGLSMNIFNQWGQYLKFAIPGMLMVCVESWYYELATVAIGTLGNTQLAVMSIVKQLQEISYTVKLMVGTLVIVYDDESFQIPLGISSAATVRVGNALGAGQPTTSQKMSVVAVGYSGITISWLFQHFRAASYSGIAVYLHVAVFQYIRYPCILIYWEPLL